MSEEKWLIPEKVFVRPDDKGRFDELFLMDGKDCIIHAEMMNDDCLWIGIYPKDSEDRRVCMWIYAKGNKLKIRAEED